MKYQVTLNGKIYEVDVTETDAVITSVTQAAAPAAAPIPTVPAAPAASAAPTGPAAQTAVAGEKITSPMPGNILAVKASVGQSVRSGDVLFILEAMKMENEIVAPHDGTVKQILVAKGAKVNTDDVLAVI